MRVKQKTKQALVSFCVRVELVEKILLLWQLLLWDLLHRAK